MTTPTKLTANLELLSPAGLIARISDLESKLAAVTAERDALKAADVKWREIACDHVDLVHAHEVLEIAHAKVTAQLAAQAEEIGRLRKELQISTEGYRLEICRKMSNQAAQLRITRSTTHHAKADALDDFAECLERDALAAQPVQGK